MAAGIATTFRHLEDVLIRIDASQAPEEARALQKARGLKMRD